MSTEERLAGLLAVTFWREDPFFYPAEMWLIMARRMLSATGVTITIEEPK